MAFIRSIAKIAEKFAAVTPGRTAEYEYGVSNPRRDWEAATVAAEPAYEQGVAQAIAKKRFGKGVKKASSAKWQKGAMEKGTVRWGPGVTLSKDDYAKGFAPYHDEIEKVKLPPRYPRRDPRNLKRVEAIALALGKRKEAELDKA
ncbi:hypothetical protein ES702_05083 [subsurface metagenome]